jgi:hypothetical protein
MAPLANRPRERAATYIQKEREVRGLPARRPTTQELEQHDLFRFEAAFSAWVSRHSEVVRQLREAFERECNAPWRHNAFIEWLSADAKGEVCAELRPLQQRFVEELEAAGKVQLTPQHVRAIVHHAYHFVQRAKWFSRGRATPTGSQLTAYKADRKRARARVKTDITNIRTRLRGLAAVLLVPRTPEEDPPSSDMLSGLQGIVGESQIGQALEALDLDGHPTEKLAFALQELDRQLQGWPPKDQPLWRGLMMSLIQIYEKASNTRPRASWTTPRSRPGRGSSDASEGMPGNAFTAYLVMIYDALPGEASPFVSMTRQGVYGHARTLLSERNEGAKRPEAQDDGSE